MSMQHPNEEQKPAEWINRPRPHGTIVNPQDTQQEHPAKRRRSDDVIVLSPGIQYNDSAQTTQKIANFMPNEAAVREALSIRCGPRSERDGLPESTWIKCSKCQRMRRIQTQYAKMTKKEKWVCRKSSKSKQNSCQRRQEGSNEAISHLLHCEAMIRYANQSPRPPLDNITRQEFQQDLSQFLKACGQAKLADKVDYHMVKCNDQPVDFLGMYKTVIASGGFLPSEKYDSNGSYKGTINFGGTVFRSLNNYTPNNQLTSVGKMLRMQYCKYLYQYEKAWMHKDNLDGLRQMNSSSQQFVLVGQCYTWGSQPTPIIPIKPTTMPQDRKGSETNIKQPNSAHASPFVIDRSKFVFYAVPAANVPPLSISSNDSVIETLLKIEAHWAAADYPEKGTMLLAQDPSHPLRQWPVIVLDLLDTPYTVLCGHVLNTRLTAFPLTRAAAMCSGYRAVPVWVFGTDMFGWVCEDKCWTFDEYLAKEVMDALDEELQGDNSSALELHKTCRAMLVFAAQIHSQTDGSADVVNGCTRHQLLAMVNRHLIHDVSDLIASTLCGSDHGYDLTEIEQFQNDLHLCKSSYQIVRQTISLMGTLFLKYPPLQQWLTTQAAGLLGCCLDRPHSIDKGTSLMPGCVATTSAALDSLCLAVRQYEVAQTTRRATTNPAALHQIGTVPSTGSNTLMDKSVAKLPTTAMDQLPLQGNVSASVLGGHVGKKATAAAEAGHVAGHISTPSQLARQVQSSANVVKAGEPRESKGDKGSSVFGDIYLNKAQDAPAQKQQQPVQHGGNKSDNVNQNESLKADTVAAQRAAGVIVNGQGIAQDNSAKNKPRNEQDGGNKQITVVDDQQNEDQDDSDPKKHWEILQAQYDVAKQREMLLSVKLTEFNLTANFYAANIYLFINVDVDQLSLDDTPKIMTALYNKNDLVPRAIEQYQILTLVHRSEFYCIERQV